MAERKQADAEAAPTDAAAAEMERQNAVAAEAARMATDAEHQRLDQTVPGGRYRTADGRMVNANGEPIKDKE